MVVIMVVVCSTSNLERRLLFKYEVGVFVVCAQQRTMRRNLDICCRALIAGFFANDCKIIINWCSIFLVEPLR